MRFIVMLSFFIFFISISNLNAAVWTDNQVWSLQYEEDFSNWMQSNAVNENIFTDPKSPYYGVSTDCADTSYAFRAIFAFEHNLPFAIYNPSGSRGTNKTINNRLNSWDKNPTNAQRLVAMINEIGDSVGTENLAYFDTFPIAIKSITPGSVFMYKIKARFGNFIRHTYNIKGINPVGTFDVIYSTQANKAHGLPLIRRKDKEMDNMPNSPFGFKKFRWPEHLGVELSQIPKELGPSDEQFSLAQTLGEVEFFKFVTKTLANTSESKGQRMTRLFKSVCSEAQARIDYVNQGLNHLKEINNKCMNYEEFDAYSTPARDQTLKELFEKYQQAYTEVVDAHEINTVSANLVEFSEIIFGIKNADNLDLLHACPIQYRATMRIDLKVLWKRILKGSLSSHPNDSVEARWGESSSNTTKCKRWY
ncbi:MAG: hypothetical protein Q7U04_10035 [Bacteriovorax sp.]|nr:hypothetical protein [Bacteriovorax sp.]